MFTRCQTLPCSDDFIDSGTKAAISIGVIEISVQPKGENNHFSVGPKRSLLYPHNLKRSRLGICQSCLYDVWHPFFESIVRRNEGFHASPISRDEIYQLGPELFYLRL